MRRVRIGIKSSVVSRSFACLALLTMTSCGDRSGLNLATVQGTVTYNGKPVDHGQVVFIPTEGVGGPSAVGEINSNGSYRMKTADFQGAAVGRHKVTVHSRRPLRPEEEKSLIIPELLIPERYANEVDTPLAIDVESGDNTFDIELVD